MTTQQAWKIIGNQDKHCIRNMVKALSMCQWLNTQEDKRRLQAAKIALKTKNPRYQ